MKVKKMTCSYGLTINLGNYQSLRLELGAEVELGEGESVSENYDHARENLRELVRKAAAKEVAYIKKQGIM